MEGDMKKLFTSLIIMVLSGCASTTAFKSEPMGADVYIDNVKIGKTPCEYSDSAIMGSSKPVRISKEGYKPLDSVIRKEKPQIGPIIGTCLVVVPVFWMLGYQDEYYYTLEKIGN